MASITHEYKGCFAYLHAIAQFLNVKPIDDIVNLPANAGKGYLRAEKLQNGLEVLINNCTVNETVIVKEDVSKIDLYTLRFDDVREPITEESNPLPDRKLPLYSPLSYPHIILRNRAEPFVYTLAKGASGRGITIALPREWMFTNLGLDQNFWNEVLHPIKQLAYFDSLTIEYRKIMEDIFALETQQALRSTILQNRVMMLIEMFMCNLHKKMNIKEHTKNISTTDTNKMIMIESILVKDIAAHPPCISTLARMATMSETKLKTLFKKVYGYSLYEYYQKNRMVKAKELISTKKYSLKEVANLTGFSNPSNFTLAYKKEFNQLPSEF